MTIKTKICMGRDLEQSQRDAIELEFSKAITAGTADSQVTKVPQDNPALRTNTRVWYTLESANNWVAYINTNFGPVSAEVVEE